MSTRLQKIQSKLADLNSRMLAQVPGPNGSRLSFHSVKGVVVILQVYPNDGFEVYAPVSLSNSIDDTFRSLDMLLEKAGTVSGARAAQKLGESTQFDLERALAGESLITRGGDRVSHFRPRANIGESTPFRYEADIELCSEGVVVGTMTQSYMESGQFSAGVPTDMDLLMVKE